MRQVDGADAEDMLSLRIRRKRNESVDGYNVAATFPERAGKGGRSAQKGG